MKVGIAGTGKIIPEAVEALREAGIQVVSIWGRNPGKAVPLAQRLGIPCVSGTYEDLLASGIDFVYIGLVNTVHYAYARTALEKGMNVLLEKPFCSTADEARDLARLAREKGGYLFEAISNIHLPNWKAVREAAKEISPIRLVTADFSQYSSRYDAYLSGTVAPSLDPAFGGGALNDLNVYCIHLVTDLLGRPESVSYTPTRGFNGVDTSGIAVLHYPHCQAVCTAAKDSDGPLGVNLDGEKGWIRIEGAPSMCTTVTIHLRGTEPVRFNHNRSWHRLCHEFAAFREIFEARDVQRMQELLDHTVLVMETLERAAASAS